MQGQSAEKNEQEMLDFSKNAEKMPVILDSFFRKIGDFRAWFRVEIRSFFGQMELFLLVFRARLSQNR